MHVITPHCVFFTLTVVFLYWFIMFDLRSKKTESAPVNTASTENTA